MSEEKRNPPIQTLQDGALHAKLWEREGKNGPYIAVTVGRTYKDEASGEYRDSHSFSGSDVLRLQALMGEAHREIGKWREYYRETGRTPFPSADKDRQDPSSAREDAPKEDRSRGQGLAAQRDAALSAAKQPTQSAGPDRSPER